MIARTLIPAPAARRPLRSLTLLLRR